MRHICVYLDASHKHTFILPESYTKNMLFVLCDQSAHIDGSFQKNLYDNRKLWKMGNWYRLYGEHQKSQNNMERLKKQDTVKLVLMKRDAGVR